MPTDTAATTDFPPFTPLNAVEERLVAATEGGPAEQAAFEDSLRDVELYCVSPPGTQPVTTDVYGTRAAFLSKHLPDGRPAVVLFTAPERIAAAMGTEVTCLQMPAATLFILLGQHPVWLNPGQRYGVVWEPDALAAMTARLR